MIYKFYPSEFELFMCGGDKTNLVSSKSFHRKAAVNIDEIYWCCNKHSLMNLSSARNRRGGGGEEEEAKRTASSLLVKKKNTPEVLYFRLYSIGRTCILRQRMDTSPSAENSWIGRFRSHAPAARQTFSGSNRFRKENANFDDEAKNSSNKPVARFSSKSEPPSLNWDHFKWSKITPFMTRIADVLNNTLQEEKLFGRSLTVCPLLVSGEAGNRSYRLVTSRPNLLEADWFPETSTQVVRFLQLGLQSARSSNV